MIKRLYVHNLRCLVNFELLLDHVSSTLIVGRNGAGKTSVIEAVQLLSSLALGRISFKEALPSSLFSKLSESEVRGAKTPPLRIELEALMAGGHSAQYHLEVEWPSTFEEPRVLQEKLDVDGEMVFARERANTRFKAGTGREPTSFPLDWHQSAVAGIQEPHEQHPLRWFKNWLLNILVLSPAPTSIEGLSRQPSRTLLPDGSNLADWYRWILVTDPEQGATINSLLRSIWPEFRTMRNEQVGPDAYDLYLEYSDSQGRVLRTGLSDLSQGEKILVVWAALLAWCKSNSNSVCLWDEVDQHVALYEIQDFLGELRRGVGSNGQFIATAHSSETMRAFTRESTVVLRRASRMLPTMPPKTAEQLELSRKEELGDILARGEELGTYGVNLSRPHVLVLPEDSAFADIANGFKSRLGGSRQVRIEGYGGGKQGLFERTKEMIESLDKYPERCLVVVFDGDARRLFEDLDEEFPADRVFLLSTQNESEDLRREFLERNLLHPNTREEIGRLLANDCELADWTHWNCDELVNCAETRIRARASLFPILFPEPS